MKYMDVKSAAEKWNITPRRVRILCNDGRIDGAVRNGWSWVIPVDTPKPRDGRVLRRFKALDIRAGSVDVDGLRQLKRLHSLEEYLSLPLFRKDTARTVSFLFSLENEEVSELECERILSGFLVHTLSLSTHLLIVNFAYILENGWTDAAAPGEGGMKRMYSSLMRGITDCRTDYRRERVRRQDEMTEISSAVETVVNQYESSWSHLHPLAGALLLAGEMLRIRPFEKHSVFFSYLLFADVLERGGYIPPSLMHSSVNEAKAAWTLVSSGGVYTDMTNYMERMMKITYGEIKKNV